MPIYKRSEFARLCGYTSGNFSNMVKREKVLLSGYYVDTSIQINAEFLADRLEYLKSKPEIVNNSEQNPAEPKITQSNPLGYLGSDRSKEIEKEIVKEISVLNIPPPQKIKNKNIQFPTHQNTDFEGLTTKGKKDLATFNKILVDTEKVELDIEHKMGKFVPTELIKKLVKQLSHEFSTAYKTQSESLIDDIGKQKGFSSEEIAKFKMKLYTSINSAHDFSLESAKKTMRKIIEEQTNRPDQDEEI